MSEASFSFGDKEFNIETLVPFKSQNASSSKSSSSTNSEVFVDQNGQAPIKTDGSSSDDHIQIEETNRLNRLLDNAYEASITMKGTFDVKIHDSIRLTVYCKDGTVHFVSGIYEVIKKKDLIEGDFKTILTIQKRNSGADGSDKYTYDPGLVYGTMDNSRLYRNGEVPVVTGSGRGVDYVNEAYKYIGNPYVWGGASLTKGCDCSGFVTQVLKRCGVSVGTEHLTSGGWRSVGSEVPPNQVQTGDILCYSGHVAFYVNSNTIVHAQSRKTGICTTTTNPLSYHGGVVTIRRV